MSELRSMLAASRDVLRSVGVFSFLINLLMLTGPLFMLQVYDRVLASGSVPTLVALSIIVALLYAYFGFLEYVRARLMVRLGRRVEEELRGKVFDGVMEQVLRHGRAQGQQAIADLVTVRQYLSGQGPLAFLDMPWVVIYLAVLFLLHWLLGVLGLLAAASIFGLALLSERAARDAVGEAARALASANQLAEESRRNAEVARALGMHDSLRRRWIASQGEALDFHTIANDAAGGYGAFSKALRLLVQSGILAFGAFLAIGHDISAGTIIAASIIVSRALAPVEQAVANWQQFLSFRKASSRLQTLLAHLPTERPKTPLPAPTGRLQIENVSVTLPGVERPILQDLTFTLDAGGGIGIIGPTGAGKTTLGRLLVGIMAPTRGTVRLDGAELDQWHPDVLGKYIGYLPQEAQLFAGTVAANIARFAANADPSKVVEAAKLASVHEMITRLPGGYDADIGEAGLRLSAGQRQRLASSGAVW
jgi:PrtD family type I secretion system ABC transporter